MTDTVSSPYYALCVYLYPQRKLSQKQRHGGHSLALSLVEPGSAFLVAVTEAVVDDMTGFLDGMLTMMCQHKAYDVPIPQQCVGLPGWI